MPEPQQDIERMKQSEREHFEQFRDGDPLPLVDVAEIRRLCLSPCYGTGNDWYSDNKMAFHQLIEQHGAWQGKYVLDYACGDGTWAAYFALTGARKVVGFDIAESGIRRARERADRQGLTDTVEYRVADASQLPFPDNEFDMVIGTAVLHHVIKYPNVFEELYRVMKPGAKAFFLEGLADFLPFKLWWWVRGPVPAGDVPIFRKEMLAKASMFSHVEVVGDVFVFSIKRLLWQAQMGPVRRNVLRAAKAADQVLFRICPPLRRWGSFSYTVMTK